MLKALVTAVLGTLILSSSVAMAQEVQLSDGRRTILIDVGGGGSRDQEMRVRRLERAVRDLQDQVWQLSVTPVKQDIWVCEATPFLDHYRSQKYALEYDAREDVRAKCEAEHNRMHCGDREISCKKIN